nr:hypothetical protein [Pandoravirus massiliensis]
MAFFFSDFRHFWWARKVKSSHYSSVGFFGLPPIDRVRAPPGRRIDKGPSIALAERPFEPDPDVSLCETRHSVTWMHTGPYTRNIGTKELVADATRDILADTGLSDRLQFFLCGFDLFRPRRDLYCLFRLVGDPKRQGPFVGAVLASEGNAVGSPRVWSQVYDLLCMFKAYHGAAAPLVVLSTYAKWRVFWLEDDTESAAPSPPVAGAFLCGPATEALCAGPIMDRADPMLVPAIATALHRMHEQVSRDDNDSCDVGESPSHRTRLAAKVSTSSKTVQWVQYSEARSTPDEACLSRLSHRCPAACDRYRAQIHGERHGDARDYVLIKDMGVGGDGHAWVAHSLCATDGNADSHTSDRVVIKFGHESTDLQPGDESDVASGGCLWREALVWRLVWGVDDVQARSLCGWPALVMPFARPVADNVADAVKCGVAPFVICAIERMAAKGICHDDLHWRHVGWIGPAVDWRSVAAEDDVALAIDAPNHSGQIVLFDLARVSARQPNKAARRMKKALGFCPRKNDEDTGHDSDDDDAGGADLVDA